MEFALPSFPTSSGGSMFGLPSFPSTAPQTTTTSLPVVPESPKVEPIYALTAKMQLISNSDPQSFKKDKHGAVTFWSDGPSIEIKIKKKAKKQNLKKSKLKINEGTVDIILEKKTLRIWAVNETFYQLISAFHIVKRGSKGKGTKVITEGDGTKINEDDSFTGRFIQWKLSKTGRFITSGEFQSFDNENASAIIKSSVQGRAQGSRILVLSQKKAMFIEIQSVTKFVRRIPTTNVANKLALLEDNADLLISKAEQYVKYKRMKIALAKLKQRSFELNAMIDSNLIMCENLKKEAEENQNQLNKAKTGIDNAAADQKTEEAKCLEERASILATLNSIDRLSGEMELESMSYEGAKEKFAKCVHSVFGAVCSGLGEGQDFSGDSLISRLENIQRLVAESFYL